MIYQRKIYPSLKRHLATRQITVITGMRRTGKTTLIKKLFEEIKSKNKIYVDLEKVSNQAFFSEKNYDNILKRLTEEGISFNKKAYIIIDEIQTVKNIPSVLKYLYDHHDIKFIVTGSSSYYLKNWFTQSLAGRKRIFELYPLDFGEFLTFKNISYSKKDFLSTKFNIHEYERLKEYYNEYIEFGGFPEVVLNHNSSEKKDILEDIISSYISIDIKTLSDFSKNKDIYNLIKILSSRAGSRLDYSKLSRLTGINRTILKEYIEFFEKTYLIHLVAVKTRNLDREIVKAQKMYFCDNGLLEILSDIGSGAKFENALYNQLCHKGEIRYYSLKTGREIDFIYNNEIALEAKETPTDLDKKDLLELSKIAGIKKYHLVGRKDVPKFNDYIWGGDIK